MPMLHTCEQKLEAFFKGFVVLEEGFSPLVQGPALEAERCNSGLSNHQQPGPRAPWSVLAGTTRQSER